MINSIEDLAHFNDDGTVVLPTGPCSAWPLSRNVAGPGISGNIEETQKAQKVRVGLGQMAQNLVKTGISAVREGYLSKDQRNARYKTCEACPHFIDQSKRCSECGCFMEAKTWLKGASCPVGKW